MCRRIITHCMHHDVAAPMIVDPTASRPIIYANPLRTKFHSCEAAPPPPHWLLNTPLEWCHYHSCCFPRERIEHCQDVLAWLGEEEEDIEFLPEECDQFILEHHHQRLPWCEDEGAYNENLRCASGEAIPTSWRRLESIRGKKSDWFPEFAHAPQYRAGWEENLFSECEKLYAIECDTSARYAAMQDLKMNNPAPWSMVQAARAEFLKAEGELHEQRKVVFGFLEWASVPCRECGDNNTYRS